MQPELRELRERAEPRRQRAGERVLVETETGAWQVEARVTADDRGVLTLVRGASTAAAEAELAALDVRSNTVRARAARARYRFRA